MNYQPIQQVESAVHDNEVTWLYEQAKNMNSIVELGSYKGKSTHALLSGCKGIVYAVDHFQGSRNKLDAVHGKSGKEEFLQNTNEFKNLILYEMATNEAVKLFKDHSIDMLFIDAGHDYDEVLEDLTLWVPKIIKLICGHDVNMPGVNSALTKYDHSYEIIGIGQLWRFV